MKTISIKLDNYLLDLLNQEAKAKQSTRMELIRSAIIQLLLNRDDAADVAYIARHKNDQLLSFDEAFSD
jgi:metal-responsive CopG/Arc/MetJ family transcriptional regulator